MFSWSNILIQKLSSEQLHKLIFGLKIYFGNWKCQIIDNSASSFLTRYKKKPLRGLIGMQKTIEIHLPHYEIPQLLPHWWWVYGKTFPGNPLKGLFALLFFPLNRTENRRRRRERKNNSGCMAFFSFCWCPFFLCSLQNISKGQAVS